MAKQQIKPPKDEDLQISDRIFSLGAWLRTLGWFAIVLGVLVAIGTEGNTGAVAAIVGGIPAVIAARLLDGFALLVEKSVITQRSNGQIMRLLSQMQQRMDYQLQMNQPQPDHRQRRTERHQPAPSPEQERVEDVFDKYGVEPDRDGER